jgi:hypothetical protein
LGAVGEHPLTEDELFEGLAIRPAHVAPVPVANRGELLYHVINRQEALEDQLNLPGHELGFDNEESGLYITPAYVRAHDRLLDAVVQDLIDQGAERRKLAGEIFAAHDQLLLGGESRPIGAAASRLITISPRHHPVPVPEALRSSAPSPSHDAQPMSAASQGIRGPRVPRTRVLGRSSVSVMQLQYSR